MIKILGLADLQTGHLAALTPAAHHRDDLRYFQAPLWDWYREALEAIGPVDLAVCAGDATEGPGRKESIGQLTTDTGLQTRWAVESLSRIRAHHRRMTYGTPYHTVGSTSYEDAVAEGWGAEEIGETVRVEAGGLRFDFRHVAGRSDTAYAQGTQLWKEVVRADLWAAAEETADADVVVRAHVHYYLSMEMARQRAVSLPCLMMPDTVFGRTCRSFYYDVGLVLFWIDPRHKEVEVRKILMPLSVVRRRGYTPLDSPPAPTAPA